MSPKAVGIIAEYNPLHRGHVHHLAKAREMSGAAFVVVLMNGDFVQRGEPAILDKWARSRLAVEGGADLVLELPFAFATAGGPIFAEGAMKILGEIPEIEAVSFGAETPDLAIMEPIAALDFSDDAFSGAFRKAMEEGLSYGRAYTEAVRAVLGDTAVLLLEKPNNKLAVEYLKHMGDMTPVPVLREEKYPPAKDLRAALAAGLTNITDHLPENAADVVRSMTHAVTCEDAFPFVLQRILAEQADSLKNIYGMEEGLENRLKTGARRAKSYAELVQWVTTKRYPYAAVSRLLMRTLVGVKKDLMPKAGEKVTAPSYLRVLAAGPKGRDLLKGWQREEGFPFTVVTDVTDPIEDAMLALDCRAADLYNLIAGLDLYKDSDYVRHPFIASR